MTTVVFTATFPTPPAVNPDKFTSGMWSVQPSGTSGEIYLNIKQKPFAERIYLRMDIRLNGGSPVAIVPGLGAQNITGLNNGVSNNVEIRTVKRDGNASEWSDVKTVTPVADSPTVLTTSTFAAALAAATNGSRLWLAAGSYGQLAIQNRSFDPPLVIRANDANAPPIFTNEYINNAVGITLRDLKETYTTTTSDVTYSTITEIKGTSSLISVIDGDRQCDVSKYTGGNAGELAYLGIPICRAMVISQGVVGVMLLRHKIHKANRPLLIYSCSEITIDGCGFWDYSSDTGQCNGVRGFWLNDCDLHDITSFVGSEDHLDGWQFQHSGATQISGDIYIGYNRLTPNSEFLTQGIFMTNESWNVVGNPAYHQSMYRVIIEENTIYTGHTNGLTIDYCDGAEISHNALIRNVAATEGGSSDPTIAWNSSTNTNCHDNVAHGVQAASGTNVATNNLLIQYTAPTQATSPYGFSVAFKDGDASGTADVEAANCPVADILAKAAGPIYTAVVGPASIRP